MKLRIVEDLEGCGSERWFILQKWESGSWMLVDSGFKIEALESKAAFLSQIDERYPVVKEFESNPQSLVDKRIDSD
jgi:hypothetical protein